MMHPGKKGSCNFIWYVVDLCDDVFVCVEENNILEAMYDFFTTTSLILKQTQRLKINHVQNSKNDVSVSSGLKVNIGRYINMNPPEDLAIPKHALFFVEGYNRCDFITTNY